MNRAVNSNILNISEGNFFTYAQQDGGVWELDPPVMIAGRESILPLYGERLHEVI